jgi:hypothetical protein
MNDWISKVREQVLTIVEGDQPDEKVTAEEETTPPETILEQYEKMSQAFWMEEEANTKAMLERSAQQCLKEALKEKEARLALEKRVAKPRKSSIEKKVETLKKKVAKHDKVLKELTANMTKIDLYRSLQQEVEDLKNENRELKLKLAKRNKEDESSLVDLTSR